MLCASELVSGNWEGTVEMHKRTEKFSTFVVEQSSSGEYSITLYYDERPYSFENIQVKDDGLTFELDTGSKYNCKLIWDDNRFFAGECTITLNDEIRTINIRMYAPEQVIEEPEPESPQVNYDEITPTK